MKEINIQTLALFLSVVFFIVIFRKTGWTKKIWSKINKKIQSKYNDALWFIFIIVFNLLVQVLFQTIDLPYHKIISKIVLGFSLACILDLEKDASDK